MATDTKLEELVINDYTSETAVIPETMPANELSVTPDTSLEKVEHDDTLSGDGTADSPLSVVGGGGSGTDNNGLEGDYAVTYGIDDETKSGLPYIKAVGSRVVVIPAPLELDVPGQPGLTTIATPIEYEVQSTDNPTLFYAQGEIIEATDVFFQVEEPENGTTGYAAWWNGTTWQFKSNDSGNVWRSANAVRIAKTVFTGTSLTRLCFTGCRVLNKQEYLSKSGGDLTGSINFKSSESFFAGIKYNGINLLTFANNLLSLVPIGGGNNWVILTPFALYSHGSLTLGNSLNPWTTVYTYKLNNGADIAVPNKAGTMALLSDVDRAATSGTLVGSYWFGKTNASTTVPAPTLPGQNYYDFTTGQIYKSTDGTTWTLDTTYTPPTDIDVQIGITSKFWDIPEQDNQHGGVAKWSHTDSDWAYYPMVYETQPAGGGGAILFENKWVNFLVSNNKSWLNAEFMWKSGSNNEVAYQHLVNDLATAGPVQTKTFEGIDISFEVATDGHRICLPDQEDNISALYAKTGAANFFILDTENARFKLPRTHKRKLLRAVKNEDGSWYNLYSDGWVEQGGIRTGNWHISNGQEVSSDTITFPIPMKDDTYYKNAICDNVYCMAIGTIPTSTTLRIKFGAYSTSRDLTKYTWEVKGYADSSVLANEAILYEYYYVG